MDVCDESDDTQSNNDDEIIDTSDDDSLTTQEISRVRLFILFYHFEIKFQSQSKHPKFYQISATIRLFP